MPLSTLCNPLYWNPLLLWKNKFYFHAKLRLLKFFIINLHDGSIGFSCHDPFALWMINFKGCSCINAPKEGDHLLHMIVINQIVFHHCSNFLHNHTTKKKRISLTWWVLNQTSSFYNAFNLSL